MCVCARARVIFSSNSPKLLRFVFSTYFLFYLYHSFLVAIVDIFVMVAFNCCDTLVMVLLS